MGDFMSVYQIRNKLRRMSRRYLWSLASAQRISKCLVGGRTCCLHLHYQGFNFCISEIMGEGCQIEKSASPSSPGKKAVEFKVYRRDRGTRSIVFLGNILERRTKERGDNITDLLGKVMKDNSYCIDGTSTIFLLGPE